ncbi:MAG: B12-binding domain-containing protein [Coriobacteriia bacterium]
MDALQVETSALLRHRREEIVATAVERQWERWPGLRESFSDAQIASTIRDTRFHVDFLGSALWADEQGLFDDYVRWVKVLFLNLELPIEWLTGSLNDVRAAIDATLEPQAAALATRTIDVALESLEDLEAELPSFMRPDLPHAALAVRYVGSILGGDRHAAVQIVNAALEDGVSVKDLYTHVFGRAQSELGRLWQMNRITVAQEHYATAVTQMVMSQLFPYVFQEEKNGFTLIAACVGGELHEIGMRMVADFFEMGHWDTHYLGANTPAPAIVEATAEKGADVLALSTTMAFHVPDVADVVEAVRADTRTRAVKVIVGGYPFNLVPDLWKRVGADGYARNAPQAVSLADEMVCA